MIPSFPLCVWGGNAIKKWNLKRRGMFKWFFVFWKVNIIIVLNVWSNLWNAVQKFFEVYLTIIILVTFSDDFFYHFTLQIAIYIFNNKNIVRVKAVFNSAGETEPLPSASNILKTVTKFYCLKIKEFSIEHATNSE